MTPTIPTDPLLVVDDDAVSRDMLSRRLERRGYVVALATSGRDALDYLASHPASLVLLDAGMPGLSGLQVLQAIRQTWTAADLPVLLVVTQDQSQDIATALDLGANDFLTKPIDFAVALARIRTQLSRQDALDRLRASEERYALAVRHAGDDRTSSENDREIGALAEDEDRQQRAKQWIGAADRRATRRTHVMNPGIGEPTDQRLQGAGDEEKNQRPTGHRRHALGEQENRPQTDRVNRQRYQRHRDRRRIAHATLGGNPRGRVGQRGGEGDQLRRNVGKHREVISEARRYVR